MKALCISINMPSKSRFKIGDKVRISKYKKKIFSKSYTPNWTEEIIIPSR